MKKCKIVHVNDGTVKVITNGNHHFAEEYPWMENLVDDYLSEGYQLKHMFPSITPNILDKGNYPFYADGFILYLEKDS